MKLHQCGVGEAIESNLDTGKLSWSQWPRKWGRGSGGLPVENRPGAAVHVYITHLAHLYVPLPPMVHNRSSAYAWSHGVPPDPAVTS